MVREYFKSGMNAWRCCECNRTAASHDSCLINDLLIQHGIVFVKSEHDCKPRQYSFVLKVQKFYNDGKFDEANSLQKSVLGSEDSNVLFKQKKVAARKTSRCLKDTEKAAADVSLQCAQEKDKYVQHHRPSFMDEDADVIPETLSPEDAFKEIIKNLKEYTHEKAEVVLLNKSKILSVLKAYRPVKRGDYFYGLSQEGKINHRLIVFEWNDRTGVREYSVRSYNVNLWICRECYKLWLAHQRYGREEHKCSWLHSVCDIMFVQIKHDCRPRSYNLVMQMQKFYEEGDITKARNLARSSDFTVDEKSFANIVNVLDVASTSNPKNTSSAEKGKEVHENDKNTKTLTNCKRKIQSYIESDSVFSDDKQPLHKRSKLNKSASEDTVGYETGTAISNSRKNKKHRFDEED